MTDGTMAEKRPSWKVALVVLAVQSALALVLYLPTRRLGFVSDAWVYIERLRHGFWATVWTPIGYHWQPVSYAWVALLREVLGVRPQLFQLVNVVQLVLLAGIVYWLGRRFLDARDSLLASLLVIGSASFYDVIYWPLAGNMHLLAAMLWLACLAVAYAVANHQTPWWGPWLLALVSLLATFCHPAMVTTIPVSLLTLFVVGRSRGDDLRTIVKAGLPLLLVVLAVLIARFAFRATIAEAPQPALDWMRAYFLVLRGVLAPFTLRGAHDPLHALFSLGIAAPLDSTIVRTQVAVWVLGSLAAGAIVFARARRPMARVLVAALAIHLALLTVGGGMASRQSIVPAALAAILSVWLLRAGANWTTARMADGRAASLLREGPAWVALLLLVGAADDHRAAAYAHVRAADASRALSRAVRAATQDPAVYELTFLNIPGSYYEAGTGALAFGNSGLVELAHAIAPHLKAVDIRMLNAPNAPAHPIPGLEPLPPEVLRKRVLDPLRPVLLYEEGPPRVRRLDAADLEPRGAR